ncbi:hypothetical protein IAE22_31365, partial [Bacillus sp. S34]|nr:hypothetical protein [Bacillus sp. S34]
MNDIQKARDVLKKWRAESLTQHWLTSIDDPALESMPNGERALQFGSFALGDARLIVGTAGNPELLDAIDGMLAVYGTLPVHHVPITVQHIATAIISAD